MWLPERRTTLNVSHVSYSPSSLISLTLPHCMTKHSRYWPGHYFSGLDRFLVPHEALHDQTRITTDDQHCMCISHPCHWSDTPFVSPRSTSLIVDNTCTSYSEQSEHSVAASFCAVLTRCFILRCPHSLLPSSPSSPCLYLRSTLYFRSALHLPNCFDFLAAFLA